MIGARFYLCAIPESMWAGDLSAHDERLTFAPFVKDALNIEARIARGVNLETERARYGLCCQRIEAAVLARLDVIQDTSALVAALQSGRFPAMELGDDYLEILERILFEPELEEQARNARLGASFFPPDSLEAHISTFKQLANKVGLAEHPTVRRRLDFLCAAKKEGCGVVEVQDIFGLGALKVDISAKRVPESLPHPSHEFAEYEPTLVSERERMSLHNILREDIERAIAEGGGAVNFSNQPHNVITEVLREFVVARPGENPTHIRVVYRDGSEAEPFPLRCLVEPESEEVKELLALNPLRVSLISMRHLDMDREVDMAWFRNTEASKPRAFAETDTFCYRETVKQLREVEEKLLLHLYHTGLEPAVVGFYRGLVNVLMERQEAGREPNIAVVPYYYLGPKGYHKGTPWY